MEIPIRLRQVVWFLAAVWMFLVVAGFCVEAWKYIFYFDDDLEWLYFFGLSYEQNLPTWYSSALLLLCAAQLVLISIRASCERAPFRIHWRVLALAFFYISLDETATIHEDVSKFFDFQGFLYFGWVVPAGILVAILAVAYLPFLLNLDGPTRTRFILAGATYVGGALGVELWLAAWTDANGTKNLGYGLIDLLEESMEILGVSIFFVALLLYLAGETKIISIRLLTDNSRESSGEPDSQEFG